MLKAKWILIPFGPYSSWFATVGPHQMLVAAHETHATASIKTSGALVWGVEAPAPYDHQTVMLQAEQELSRRLAVASETLSGEMLEAGQTIETCAGPLRVVADPECPRGAIGLRYDHVEVKSEQTMTAGMWRTLAQSWLAKAAVVSAAAAEPYGLTTSRRCSHEGCTTPPPADSWMCCNHDNQIASGYRRDER